MIVVIIAGQILVKEVNPNTLKVGDIITFISQDWASFGETVTHKIRKPTMDSMGNHYTAAKRLRSDDAYTPEGKAGQRPDYAVTVYTKILKSIYPDIPVVIGGIEASLRRVTHYDYWQNALKPSMSPARRAST